MGQLLNFLKQLRPARPLVTSATVTRVQWVTMMHGDNAHKCQGCGQIVYVSPLYLGGCPSCHSADLRNIDEWLRSEKEQAAHTAARPERWRQRIAANPTAYLTDPREPKGAA